MAGAAANARALGAILARPAGITHAPLERAHTVLAACTWAHRPLTRGTRPPRGTTAAAVWRARATWRGAFRAAFARAVRTGAAEWAQACVTESRRAVAHTRAVAGARAAGAVRPRVRRVARAFCPAGVSLVSGPADAVLRAIVGARGPLAGCASEAGSATAGTVTTGAAATALTLPHGADDERASEPCPVVPRGGRLRGCGVRCVLGKGRVVRTARGVQGARTNGVGGRGHARRAQRGPAQPSRHTHTASGGGGGVAVAEAAMAAVVMRAVVEAAESGRGGVGRASHEPRGGVASSPHPAMQALSSHDVPSQPGLHQHVPLRHTPRAASSPHALAPSSHPFGCWHASPDQCLSHEQRVCSEFVPAMRRHLPCPEHDGFGQRRSEQSAPPKPDAQAQIPSLHTPRPEQTRPSVARGQSLCSQFVLHTHRPRKRAGSD